MIASKNYNPLKSLTLLLISCVFFSILIYQPVAANEQHSINNSVISPKIVGGNTARIIGGSVANRSAWPWIVALTHTGIAPIDGQFCGGSLIDPEWVLTAAHCVVNESPDNIEAFIGESRLSDTNGGEFRSIERIIIHPSFNQFTLEFDLALLKLERPASFRPIQTVGRFSTQDDPDKSATALGWGSISPFFMLLPIDLHQVELPIVSNEVCNESMSDITGNMLCAGTAEGDKDTCIGDSGGPLVVYNKLSQSWRQAGITSFGNGCARPGFFGVYTRLEKFSKFISATICEADEIPGTPVLAISVDDRRVTASWNQTDNASGYRLNYAPYPELEPIYSRDMNQNTSLSIELNQDAAFYVAINAYNNNCRSKYSNIEHFIVP